MDPQEVDILIDRLRESANTLALVRQDFSTLQWPKGTRQHKVRKQVLENIAGAEADIRNLANSLGSHRP